MKKTLLALTGLLAMASASSFALDTNTSPAWSCNPLANQHSSTGFQWCRLNLTSATTAANIGRVSIYPSKQITVVGGISGSAVANVVTPTINLYLGNQVVATQNISVSTAGNVVTLGVNGVPYFDGLSISQSTPSLISQTNSLIMGVIESNRIYSAQ